MQMIKKLPAIFQTTVEKKFFDAAFDQVFSKKDSDLLYGYIGQRIPGRYNPISDFYIPESSKDRTWWQLEATAFARTEDATKTNVFFYDDLLNRINYYGGNTLNQDRLFESEYYSWAPPIDVDMFTNYQSYFWLEHGLSTISITGAPGFPITAATIEGNASYTTPLNASPPGLTLTTGMKISLPDDVGNSGPFTIQNVGCRKYASSIIDTVSGIRLVPEFPDYTDGTILEFLPWDGRLELSSGRVIINTTWDTSTWDVQPQPGNADYITIERGSVDRNAWSRTNKWFHIDAITSSMAATNTPFPLNATVAVRPIIQFTADLILYNSGTQFRSEIAYGFRNNLLGSPLFLTQFQGLTQASIDAQLDIQLNDLDFVVFMEDSTASANPSFMVKEYIYQTNIDINTNIVTFIPYTSLATPIIAGDITFIINDGPFDGAQRGQTWYYNNAGTWLQSANDKITTNQPPLFQLYDHDGIPLNDTITYPQSTFAGSKIFSYKINTDIGAMVDPVLKFPIVYTSLHQASDIIFQNNLITDRYVYSAARLPISGYYYYTSTDSVLYHNGWNLYNLRACGNITSPLYNYSPTSKQYVIDKFVVGYGSEYEFKLSVTPYSYALNDFKVSVNGTRILNDIMQPDGYSITTINGKTYVNLQTYITALLLTTQAQPPVVEIQTYTHGLLDPNFPGYFNIPQQLEANPLQLEVGEISASNLIEQFSSIIQNQIDFVGSSFGGTNNHRDSLKNNSLGSFILQNMAPALKSMLISSSNDLDIIPAIRFSQEEYQKFKNKYLKTALQLINREFSPVQYHNNTIVVGAWVEEILKTVNISKEFSHAFGYSYMIANGGVSISESHTIPISGLISLTNYIDLADMRNALYIYDTTGVERLLLIGEDYEIVSTNLAIEVQFNLTNVPSGNTIYIALYKDPLPAYIPSTPTKVGTYGTYVPRTELDTTYAIPTTVIIGHDGSKTIAYGDYRDNLLLELERRIYNLLQYRFRHQYSAPLRIEDIRPGYYRETRYSREEFLEITQSYINKWSAKNRANYRTNEWDSISINPALNIADIWKLYNYSAAVDISGVPLGLVGNWKGIFQYYYDSYYPDTRPWEMLGFSEQPSWWAFEYGPGTINLSGQQVWTSTAVGNNNMWSDLEAGIIRQGPSAIFDPVTLLPQPQTKWVRNNLSTHIPVDSAGELIPVPTLFNLAMSGNIYAPFDGFDNDWVYGDGGPVEQAWMSTSGYTFNIQEFLYLMRPGPFGELLFDTIGTEISSGKLTIPGIDGPVISNIDRQYIQNNIFASSDPLSAWTRPKNVNQVVHAELVNGIPELRFGYQRWISDRILFLGKDVASVFGQKIRTLDVNLANKLGGFTNKDTTSTYIESVTPGASTTSLSVPTNNFDVLLHKGQPIKTYSYSGIIIRALENGLFVVYGYDLLKSEFTVLERSNAQLIDITVGGTPAEFKLYTTGETYIKGDIVRYNGVYYTSRATQLAGKFNSSGWDKLKALPVVGGVSVTYRPISEITTVRVPYGSIFRSVQEVFDLIIGWGAFLESEGWQFNEVSSTTNQLSDWLYSAKQFLFWLNTNWAPDASIQLSPAANSATLTVKAGYPDDVETISNGVYSILDKYGVAITPGGTTTDRDGMSIMVSPVNLATGGIYFLQVNASETEHILIFDNSTSFGDSIYDPLLRARQQRLRFNGFRSNGWYGKMEAPGYLIIDNQLVPNYDTIVEAMRYYYDPNIIIDNQGLEDLGRHLIGYESKKYLDDMQISNDVQYLFYQGAIRQKGTVQTFDKLFRSTVAQGNETISVFEEWALKLGEFGNSVEQVSTEFIVMPEQDSGEVAVARLNFVPSTIGSVKQINILNAENTYLHIPKIVITSPNADPNDPALIEPLRQAKAYAILDSGGKILRIDMADAGYGYIDAPIVTIVSGSEPNNLDRLYAIWNGGIIRDLALENIIEIDIDDTTKWVIRPPNPVDSLTFPITDIIDYPLPNAGYVNFNDVTWASFDIDDTITKWGTTKLNPRENNTIWVAKTYTEDWDVFKMVNILPVSSTMGWHVVEDLNHDLLLLTTYDTIPANNLTLVPQNSDQPGQRTDFGNTICLQVVAINNTIDPATNYIVTFADNGLYTDPTTLVVYNSYALLTIDNIQLTSNDIGVYAELTDLLLFKSMRFQLTQTSPTLPDYVNNGDLIWVDDVVGKWTVVNINTHRGLWDISIPAFWKAAVEFVPAKLDPTPLYFTPYRMQESLIDTSLFENAQVFRSGTEEELITLPVYDPFKYILPAAAKQNITYMSAQDPAKYNVTSNFRLFNDTTIFKDAEVGKIWWDLSAVRYVYYEQPMRLDNGETPTENLVYRRTHWGQIFPGSSVDIYEWVKSSVPPNKYSGKGVPKNTTDYVMSATSNRFTNITETNYYFWVLGSTTKPNIENRTLTALEVSRMLSNPKAQGFAFFAPIQQTGINNSYMFYNVQEILAYKGNQVKVQYQLTPTDGQKHDQWSFFREGDSASLVSSQFWDKMVDSLCGYTRLLSASDEWSNSLFIAHDLPWDIYGWDIAPWDDATDTESAIYGEILPVPEPALSEYEKYGIKVRPLQGMFIDIYAARKVFVQSCNTLLQHIPIRDNNSSWSINVITDTYWAYSNWYEIGFENVIPNISFSTLGAAQLSLAAGQFANGTIVEITNGTPDGRFVLYNVEQLNPNIITQSFRKVGIEKSAINLLNTMYTTKNIYELSTELRSLLNAFRTEVFINNFVTYQNEMYFSLLNYVLSEQKNPDWLFKTSYIYIKENNLSLSQDKLYVPDQIDNIISYIVDAKPYHTQVRDYTSSYITSDVAAGTAADSVKNKTILTFDPTTNGGWDTQPWNTNQWDTRIYTAERYILDARTFADNINQLVSHENILTIPLTFFDSSKIGYSQLFPYTFDFNSINLNNPQSFITPANIIAVQVGNDLLYYGQDYYVEFNSTTADYTAYFFSDPGITPAPIAFVYWDGGTIMNLQFDSFRNELAFGIPNDNFVVNVDTLISVNNVSGTYYPMSPWGVTTNGVDPLVASVITANGGIPVFNPLTPLTIEMPWANVTISYKQNLGIGHNDLYRNAYRYSGTLLIDLPAPTSTTENLDVITIFVDPATHPITTDILTDTGIDMNPGVIWIDGERIEYRQKTITVADTWELRLVRRGTGGTVPDAHAAMIPSLADPLILVSNPVWVDKHNEMPATSSIDVWNATDSTPDYSTAIGGGWDENDTDNIIDNLMWDSTGWDVGIYTNVAAVSSGGIWYADTLESEFLKAELGTAIP